MTTTAVTEGAADVDLARQGDRAAFGRLYARNVVAVRRFIARLVGGNRPLAEDLTADTFTRALAGLRGFTEGDENRFLAWLYVIARRLVVDHWKAHARRCVPFGDLADLDHLAAIGVDGHRAVEDRLLVGELLAAVSPDHAAILTARYLADQSPTVMAARAGRHVGAVKSQLYRACLAARQAHDNPAPRDPAPHPASTRIEGRPMAQIVNADQHRILASYAAGTDVGDVAERLDLTRDYVTGVVSRLCGLDRSRAGQMVIEYEKRRNGANGHQPAPAPPVSAPERPAAAAAVPEVADDLDFFSEPVRAVPAKAAAAPETFEELLDEAEASDLPKIRTTGAKIRAMLVDLAATLSTVRAEQETRAEIARLEQQLAEARAKLGGTARRTPATRSVADGAAVPAREVRAWAASAGVTCPAAGRVPAAVLEAYRQAHADGTS